MKMNYCRRKVEEAIRRHRMLADKPFPEGECGQPECVHSLVRELVRTSDGR